MSLAPPAAGLPAQQPPADPADDLEVVLVLVGLVGSGKSTFAHALAAYSAEPEWAEAEWAGGPEVLASNPDAPAASTSTAPPEPGAPGAPRRRRRWARASQDDAPGRRRQECEGAVRAALRDGMNVVVDRVDFDAAQRAHFVSIAQAHRPRPHIHALVLPVSHETLVSRLAARTGHPTLPDAPTALRVLGEMGRVFDPPGRGGEGFDRVFVLREDEQPAGGAWGAAGVRRVLARIEGEGVADPAGEGQAAGRAQHGRDGRDGRDGRADGYARRGQQGRQPRAPYPPHQPHQPHQPPPYQAYPHRPRPAYPAYPPGPPVAYQPYAYPSTPYPHQQRPPAHARGPPPPAPYAPRPPVGGRDGPGFARTPAEAPRPHTDQRAA